MAQDKNQKNGSKKNPFSIYWIYAILGIGLIAYQYYYSSSSKIPLKTVAQFESLAEGGYVENVTIVINKLRADIRLNDDGIGFLKSILSLLTVTTLFLAKRVAVIKATSSISCIAVPPKRVS